jgi:NAD(P)-dependent dehydrogenase (short-subunit alcohol dehydrogenase family)
MALLDTAAIDEVLDVNLKGVIHGLAAAGPAMLGLGGGSTVNTASTAAMLGTALSSVYCASKGEAISLTRAAAAEFAPTVRVNAIAPEPWHIEGVGSENILFETDFPHPTCLYGDEITAVEDVLAGHPQDVRENILWRNAARLYRLDLGAAT